MFEVESGIPVPPDARGLTNKYPWNDMKVGDSFFVPDRPDGRRSALSSSVNYQHKKSGNTVKYATRKVTGGVRVWRVE